MSKRPSHIGSDGVDFRTAPLHECLYGKNPVYVWQNYDREDDECQPDYCDCEGYCTGMCRQRQRLKDRIEWMKSLDKELKIAYYRSIYNQLAKKYEHTPESH